MEMSVPYSAVFRIWAYTYRMPTISWKTCQFLMFLKFLMFYKRAEFNNFWNSEGILQGCKPYDNEHHSFNIHHHVTPCGNQYFILFIRSLASYSIPLYEICLPQRPFRSITSCDRSGRGGKWRLSKSKNRSSSALVCTKASIFSFLLRVRLMLFGNTL